MAKLETIWRQKSDDKHRNALKKVNQSIYGLGMLSK